MSDDIEESVDVGYVDPEIFRTKLSSARLALINILNSLDEPTSLGKEDLMCRIENLVKTCSNFDSADAEFPAELRKIENLEKILRNHNQATEIYS
ncbi:hypothetical protein AVEN_128990-1 [Araneus ventricosus]|uniref:Uncharacterized protein n=1 Tax=Araneus ventricosus TaxID=182803 RepID=A0A4Y2GCB5_ARAVE|nr:hypothetical protein AVEN_128990-1 [Araneus ventricosus]